MSWTRFSKLLETRPLDRETKLMLIDLLARTDDAKLEEELFTFVFAWEEAQAKTQKQLLDGIKRVTDEYAQDKEKIGHTIQKNVLSIADDIHRQKRIEDLRASIKSL
ncbi:hypothetical protein HQ487_00515 [Candidatus Uhrbacteria bacterium]|nr:hypothetical protein [Candidatus Uhrbacteria bacterium]